GAWDGTPASRGASEEVGSRAREPVSRRAKSSQGRSLRKHRIPGHRSRRPRPSPARGAAHEERVTPPRFGPMRRDESSRIPPVFRRAPRVRRRYGSSLAEAGKELATRLRPGDRFGLAVTNPRHSARDFGCPGVLDLTRHVSGRSRSPLNRPRGLWLLDAGDDGAGTHAPSDHSLGWAAWAAV